MYNLRKLRLETPDCNAHETEDRLPWIALQDRYERAFQAASVLLPTSQRRLPNLENCMRFPFRVLGGLT
jgi:hypothetical protein